MKIHRLSDHLSMIDVQPPIPGQSEFIGPYVLSGEQVALIDVGPHSSAGNLIKGLTALHIDPQNVSYIFITHIHIDHAGATADLLNFLPNAQVVVHPRGAAHLVNTEKLWQGSLQVLGDLAEKYGRPPNIPQERILLGEDGMRIGLGNGVELEVIHTPGHAAHHLSFLEQKSGLLFAGEAGGDYVAKIDLLRPATPPPLIVEYKLASIDKLLERKPITIYYAHFGSGGDAQSKLRRYREQLKLWESVVSEALRNGAQSEGVFSTLMEKDVSLEGLNKLPDDQYQRECYFMYNSIKGFVG
ncbi:MAG: putative diflavin flavoprotein A 3 [Dehalococcoidia bacterium]|nr:putative diflavin flavoprotein A 3 [Bacillota bacterium]